MKRRRSPYSTPPSYPRAIRSRNQRLDDAAERDAQAAARNARQLESQEAREMQAANHRAGRQENTTLTTTDEK